MAKLIDKSTGVHVEVPDEEVDSYLAGGYEQRKSTSK